MTKNQELDADAIAVLDAALHRRAAAIEAVADAQGNLEAAVRDVYATGRFGASTIGQHLGLTKQRIYQMVRNG